MSGKKRTAAETGTFDSGKQMNFEGFNTLPLSDYTPNKGSIASMLSRGRENAVTSRELSRLLDVSPREVQRFIQRERRSGAPIMSDSEHGYWLAESREELLNCVAALHLRAGEIHKTARALEKIARR